MATEVIQDQWTSLRQAKDYREFLEEYLKLRELKISEFARATGYGRDFPSAVLRRKRGLTEKSLVAFEGAMRSLPASGKKLFRLLVIAEENLGHSSKDQDLVQQIETLRQATWKRTRKLISDGAHSGIDRFFKNAHASRVYAASGSPERGATYAEIAERSQVSTYALDQSLTDLLQGQLIEYNSHDERYYPKALHLFLQTKKDQNDALKLLFTEACRKAQHRASEAIPSESEFFFTSDICISVEQMPQLKQALRETILNFVDSAIQEEGNRVVKLTTTFHL